MRHAQSHGLGNRTFNPASQIAGREKRLMASNVIMVADVILSELLDSQTVFQEDRRSTSPQGSIPENSETFVLSFLGLSYVCPVICNKFAYVF